MSESGGKEPGTFARWLGEFLAPILIPLIEAAVRKVFLEFQDSAEMGKPNAGVQDVLAGVTFPNPDGMRQPSGVYPAGDGSLVKPTADERGGVGAGQGWSSG